MVAFSLLLLSTLACRPWSASDLDLDGFSVAQGDCDDGDPAAHPGATDPLGVGGDSNCDGVDGIDADGDAVASAESGGTDCDDSDPSTHPGADEACDGVDNDCDGEVDEPGALDGTLWFRDADGDGHGDPDAPERWCAAPAEGWSSSDDDCDDSDADFRPGVDEVCDGVDNDCDGEVDEARDWYPDADGDGYGTAEGAPLSAPACSPPVAAAAQVGDCDDSDPAVSPGALERCGNRIDDDCDGQVDRCDTDSMVQLAAGDGSGVRTLGYRFLLSDLTGDGQPDVATTSEDNDDVRGVVLIPGPLDEVWAPEVDSVHVTGAAMLGLSEADLDGDRLNDLILLQPAAEGDAAYILHGPITASAVLPDDGLRIEGSLPIHNERVAAAPGDVSGDGITDLLLAASAGDGDAAYLLHGPLTAALALEEAAAATFRGRSTRFASDAAVADFDGDGLADVVLSTHSPQRIAVFAGGVEGERDEEDADGLLSLPYTDQLKVSASPDQDGDGLPELLVAERYTDWTASTGGSAWVVSGASLLPSAEGSVEDAAAWVVHGGAGERLYYAAAPGDLDGDGVAELSISARYTLTDSRRQVYLFWGGARSGAWESTDADLRIRSAESLNGPMSGADMDGDGIDDVVIGSDDWGGGAGALFMLRGGG